MRARCNDIELPRRGRMRPAEYRRRHVAVARLRVKPRHALAHPETHGRHVHVHARCGHLLDEAAADPHGLDRGVIREHGDDHLRVENTARIGCDLCSLRGKRLRGPGTAVVDNEPMPRLEQPPGHRPAHLAEPYETHRHGVRPPVDRRIRAPRSPIRGRRLHSGQSRRRGLHS